MFPKVLHVSVTLLRCNHRRLIALFLLLILDQLDIILGHLLILVTKPLQNILAQISLHSDDLSHTTGQFCRRTSSSELLAHLLCNLLDVEAERFETGDFGDVFALVAFDALDYDFGGGEFFGAAGFGGGGFGFLLFGVLFGAFLGVDREGGEVGCYGVCGECKGQWRAEKVEAQDEVVEGGEGEEKARTFRVELAVEVGMLRLEPFCALLCGATEFTVL